MTQPEQTNPRGKIAAAVIVLLIAGAFAYSSGLSGPFIFDDIAAIEQNPSIRSLWPIWRTLKPRGDNTFAGRPLVNLSFAINYAISGMNVRGYHVTNIAIHLLAAVVLFGLLRRALRLPRVPDFLQQNADIMALGCALVWEVHPLLTEVVTYTSTRTEGLMSFFFLLTFYCFARLVESPQRKRWAVATVVACVLGCGCKEVMSVAPVLIYLFDVLLVSGSFSAPLKRRTGLYVLLVATMAIAPILVATQADFKAKTGEGFVLTNPWTYALTETGVILHYVRLAFWPDALTIDYADWPLARSVGDVLPQVICVLALVAATAYGVWRRWPAAFLGAWFFVILAPTSSFIPLRTEVAAERRMYLPLIALVVGVGAIFTRAVLAIKPVALRGAAVLLVPALAGTLALTTWWRNADYSTAIMIFSDAVAKRPNNARASGAKAEALRVAGRFIDAREAYENAVRVKPWDANYQFMLGSLLIGEGRLDEAKTHLADAIVIDPKLPGPRTSMGIALARQGDQEGALRQFREALMLDPKQVDALVGIADILAARGDKEEALLHLRSALRLAPDDADLRQKAETLKAQLSATRP